ncbi:MAG: hypothetical protein JWO00_73 [Candidatus Parcubacteria bacterium]|nr:hypothetical protein [Candidatus Parcubacteria bacterium]
MKKDKKSRSKEHGLIKFIVLESGWLWISERYKDPLVKKLADGHVDILNRALEGIKPDRFDNSPFWKVDPKYVGQTLIANRTPEDLGRFGLQRAFLADGTLVRVKTEYPLLFKTWKKVPKKGQFTTLVLDEFQLCS